MQTITREELMQNESDYTRIRVLELKTNPVKGQFDANHLREINRRILQDLPSYNGGEFCLNVGQHTRIRTLSNTDISYKVHYLSGKVTSAAINAVIANAGPMTELSKLSEKEFSEVLSTLFADLDHIHAFNDANSRTLRIFTEQFADACGFKLDWTKTNGGNNVRDTLYQARDIEVSKRSYPGLSIDSLRDASRDEMEAYDTQKILSGAKNLSSIFVENITKYTHAMNLKFG